MVNFDLTGTPHTLIIPLAGRAHSRSLFPKEEFDDPSARQVMARLNYKNPLITKNPFIVKGAVGRALAFQQESQYFLDQYPHVTVVNMGCGLSNYFQWLDNDKIRWIDVDLPEVMKIRHQLMPVKNERIKTLVGSILDESFFDRLEIRSNEPTLFLCEGVLMYFTEEQVSQLLRRLGEKGAKGSQIIFDHIASLAVGSGRWNPLFKRWGTDFLWGIDHLQDLDQLDAKFKRVHSRSLDATSLPTSWVKNLYEYFSQVPAHCVSVLELI